jgi:Gpi18-like mannosyltransferase
MKTQALSDNFQRVPAPAWLVAGLAIWAIVYAPFLGFSVSDFRNFVGPWLIHIRDNGGLLALSGDFSEYAPPYLYLLSAVSYFDFPFSDQVLVKLLNAPFVVLVAVSVFQIVAHFGGDRPARFLAAGVALVLPTLGVNAFIWGQADAIYGSLLLLTVLLMLKRRPYWAIVVFAAALSTKLQAMFLAPFMAMMFLAGHIPWRALLLAPLVYGVSILPAALVGRPLQELVQVYLVQGRFYSRLSFNAPNPYFFLEYFFNASSVWRVYQMVTAAGLLLSMGVGALISAIGVGRKHLSDRAILIAAALSTTIMPYVLPKMHDRYFIGGDLLTFALACIDRRFVWTAVAMQVSSSLAMAPEFALYALPGEPGDWTIAVVVGAVINAGVIAHLALSLKRELGRFLDGDAIRRVLPAAMRQAGKS